MLVKVLVLVEFMDGTFSYTSITINKYVDILKYVLVTVTLN